MKKIALALVFLGTSFTLTAQENTEYKKRVLETTEIDIISGFYAQDGDNASVTGGIGSEELTNFASTIVVSIPINDDDVLTIDGTVSAYSSASSSNLNPFSGASGEHDDDHDHGNAGGGISTGTPWQASSGASEQDVWRSLNVGYSHSSDDRNQVYSANLNVAGEYDYRSFGGGVAFAQLFNEKNTELSLGVNVYLDKWLPQYPTELSTFVKTKGDFTKDFFANATILNQKGEQEDKANSWKPKYKSLIDDESRNTYTFNLGGTQILTENFHIALFTDITYQDGWLANPLQRVYFKDKPNYYVGTPGDIQHYTDKSKNKGVFHLADDIERLPNTRLKIPIGMRANYFVNEDLVLRTYYRYYYDDWDMRSNTAQIEIAYKLNDYYTLTPSYRYYQQNAVKYFAGYNEHLSTDRFYTSDYDLSEFTANQYGMGFAYTDVFTEVSFYNIALKQFALNANYYDRSNSLSAFIVSVSAKFILDSEED